MKLSLSIRKCSKQVLIASLFVVLAYGATIGKLAHANGDGTAAIFFLRDRVASDVQQQPVHAQLCSDHEYLRIEQTAKDKWLKQLSTAVWLNHLCLFQQHDHTATVHRRTGIFHKVPIRTLHCCYRI